MDIPQQISSDRPSARVSLAGLAWAILMLSGCGDPGSKTPTVAVPAGVATQAVATIGGPSGNQATLNVTKLVGRWLRPDGGYILEVRSVDSTSGRMDAVYFNPRPIHVAQAEAKEADGKLAVFVELRDVGYPGSTYRLVYLPAVDQLIGTYYQPTADQTFDVEFVRVP